MINAPIICGIDPGKTGGLAKLLSDGSLIVHRFDGIDPLKILDLFLAQESFVALESVHAFPGQGLASTFNFGLGFGKLQGWLWAKRVQFSLCTPQRWQKIIPHGSDPKTAIKAFCEAKWGLERFIFPGCRVPHQGCMDAACIAEFHRLIITGEIDKPKDIVSRKKKRSIKF